MKKHIAIVAGGFSHEAQISIKSAATVLKHLPDDMEGRLVMIEPKAWYVLIDGHRYPICKDDFSYHIGEEKKHFDAAFIAIHGTPGEDGKLQAYFDMIGLPYNTGGHLAMTLSFNKYACNSYLREHGMRCAPSVLVLKGDEIDREGIIGTCGLPCFVKPNDGGSSFGVTKVEQEDQLTGAIEKALEHGQEVIIEAFMKGREVTCGIVQLNGELNVLPVTEIKTNNPFFDFEAKYQGASEEITPAEIGDALTDEVQRATAEAYRLLNLKGIARADFILKDNVPHIIEINTVPGLSDASLIPQQAAHVGMELSTLFGTVLRDCMNG